MINFKSRNEVIRNADRLTRSVNTVYPHIYGSKLNERISKQILFLDFGSPQCRKLSDLSLKFADRIKKLRTDVSSGIELLKNVIDMFKNGKIGNCYEAARLTEIMGRINGQENIYPMKIFVSRNKSGALLSLDHDVAVVTKKKIEPKEKYNFKGNEAIILDPLLGVTEFCGTYLEKLKNDYANLFLFMENNEFQMKRAAKTSKTLKEFKQKRKEECFNPTVKFLLHEDGIAKPDEVDILKEEFPELIIKNYKSIG